LDFGPSGRFGITRDARATTAMKASVPRPIAREEIQGPSTGIMQPQKAALRSAAKRVFANAKIPQWPLFRLGCCMAYPPLTLAKPFELALFGFHAEAERLQVDFHAVFELELYFDIGPRTA